MNWYWLCLHLYLNCFSVIFHDHDRLGLPEEQTRYLPLYTNFLTELGLGSNDYLQQQMVKVLPLLEEAPSTNNFRVSGIFE